MDLSHSFPLPGIQCPGFEARHFWKEKKKESWLLVEGEGPPRGVWGCLALGTQDGGLIAWAKLSRWMLLEGREAKGSVVLLVCTGRGLREPESGQGFRWRKGLHQVTVSSEPSVRRGLCRRERFLSSLDGGRLG